MDPDHLGVPIVRAGTLFVYTQISILRLFCEAVVHTNIHRDTLETVLYPPRIGISELHIPCVSPSSSADVSDRTANPQTCSGPVGLLWGSSPTRTALAESSATTHFSFRTPDEENIGLRVEPFRMPFCESRRKGSLERFAFLCR